MSDIRVLRPSWIQEKRRRESGKEDKMAERTRTRGQSAIAAVVMSSPASRRSMDKPEIDVSAFEILMARFDQFEKVVEDKIDRLDTKFTRSIAELDSKIEERLENIDTNIGQVQGQVDETSEDIVQINSTIKLNKKEQEQNRREISVLKQQLKMAEESKGKLNTKVNELEDKSRILNIKVEGKKETDGENLIDFIQNMVAKMGITGMGPSDYEVARIGKKISDKQPQVGRTHRPRTIMLIFNRLIVRNKFYYARTKLGKQPEFKGIYVNDDVSNVTMKHRDEFRAVAALARAKGDEVRVHGDGIIINKIKYRYDDTLPQEYSLSKAKVVEMNGQIYFQSEYAHLSNFHPAPIVDNGIYYPTAEHHYQAAKCRQAGESNKLSQILKVETPLEAKRIGDSVVETIEWRRQKEMKMEITINLKYEQNPKLAALLLGTNNKSLNEATGNTFFGIGANLHSKALRDRSYGGLNKLGAILENKRSELRSKNDQTYS